MYDPSIGRWLEEDPLGFEAGDANLYRYVGNGPTNCVDSNGLFTVSGSWAGEVQVGPIHIHGSLDFHLGIGNNGLSYGGGYTLGISPGIGLGAGTGPQIMLTNADDVSELGGNSVVPVGGFADLGAGGSASIVSNFVQHPEEPYWGITIGMGPGIGGGIYGFGWSHSGVWSGHIDWSDLHHGSSNLPEFQEKGTPLPWGGPKDTAP